MSRTSIRTALLLVALLASASAWAAIDTWKPWALARPAPVADGLPASLEGWRDIGCARCHAAIAEEWASSRHALAWVDELYQEQIADMKRPEACHGCHAPEPLAPQSVAGKPPQKPKARDLNPRSGAERELDAHFGISCSSCHLAADGAMLGPYGAETQAHVSRKDALFTAESEDALCIACHATNVGPVTGIAKDFVDSGQSKTGKSCVGCHMQPLERPIAAEEGRPHFATRAGRSHALQTPRDPGFLARAFAFSALERGEGVQFTVHNECGHRVPGLIGRKIVISAELQDERGRAVARSTLVIDKSQHLPVDGEATLSFAARGVRVKLSATHDAPGFEAPVTFLATTIPVAK